MELYGGDSGTYTESVRLFAAGQHYFGRHIDK